MGIVHVMGRNRRDLAGDDHCLRRLAHRHPQRVGALAFGIGTSEVEHVLATQTLKNRAVRRP
ncbi:hypothetical protein ACLB1Q_16180 [Escherichia coli]